LNSDQRILDRMTVGDLITRYRDSVSQRKKCRSTERYVLNAFLRTDIARLSLSEVRPTDFARYRDERLRKVKAATINRELGPIQHAFEIAVREWGLPLPSNPVGAIRKPAPDGARVRRLHVGEWESLKKASERSRNPVLWPVAEFALATAMRRSEILGLSWDQVNWEHRTLTLPTSKNGHARSVPLGPKAISVLKALNTSETKEERIFPISPEAAKLSWKRLVNRAAVSDLHFHDLRHEAISRFFELGLSLPEVALISGHRDPRMLFRYTHLRASEIATRLQSATDRTQQMNF
jgi:integrase